MVNQDDINVVATETLFLSPVDQDGQEFEEISVHTIKKEKTA